MLIDKYTDNARLGRANLALFFAVLLMSLGMFFLGQVPLTIAAIIGAENINDIKDTNSLVEGLGFFKFFILISFQFIFLLLTTILCYRIFHKLNYGYLWSAIGKFRFKHFFIGVVITIVLQGASFAITYYSSPEDFTWNFQPEKFWWLVLIGLLIIPIQTLAEELFFRGYIYQQLGWLFRNKWIAWLISGILFGSMHLMNPEVEEFGFWKMVIVYIGTGLMIGLSVMFTEGLEFAWGYHLINNFILTVFISFPGSALQGPTLFRVPKPNGDYLLIEFFVSFVVFLLILMIFYPKRIKKLFQNEGTIPEEPKIPTVNEGLGNSTF